MLLSLLSYAMSYYSMQYAQFEQCLRHCVLGQIRA